jgi:hypothetical protein
MIKLLINNGASTQTRTGIPCKSPMQLAAAGGHLEVMEELAKHGYEWKEKDDWGWTLLNEVAVENQKVIKKNRRLTFSVGRQKLTMARTTL